MSRRGMGRGGLITATEPTPSIGGFSQYGGFEGNAGGFSDFLQSGRGTVVTRPDGSEFMTRQPLMAKSEDSGGTATPMKGVTDKLASATTLPPSTMARMRNVASGIDAMDSYAGGGPMSRSRRVMHLVGEKGRELLVPKEDGGYHVLTNPETEAVLKQAGPKFAGNPMVRNCNGGMIYAHSDGSDILPSEYGMERTAPSLQAPYGNGEAGLVIGHADGTDIPAIPEADPSKSVDYSLSKGDQFPANSFRNVDTSSSYDSSGMPRNYAEGKIPQPANDMMRRAVPPAGTTPPVETPIVATPSPNSPMVRSPNADDVRTYNLGLNHAGLLAPGGGPLSETELNRDESRGFAPLTPEGDQAAARYQTVMNGNATTRNTYGSEPPSPLARGFAGHWEEGDVTPNFAPKAIGESTRDYMSRVNQAYHDANAATAGITKEYGSLARQKLQNEGMAERGVLAAEARANERAREAEANAAIRLQAVEKGTPHFDNMGNYVGMAQTVDGKPVFTEPDTVLAQRTMGMLNPAKNAAPLNNAHVDEFLAQPTSVQMQTLRLLQMQNPARFAEFNKLLQTRRPQ
jgi:hypothetical protein